jgi:hypothetical protein
MFTLAPLSGRYILLVPEPATLAMLLCGALALIGRRCRKDRSLGELWCSAGR